MKKIKWQHFILIAVNVFSVAFKGKISISTIALTDIHRNPLIKLIRLMYYFIILLNY